MEGGKWDLLQGSSGWTVQETWGGRRSRPITRLSQSAAEVWTPGWGEAFLSQLSTEVALPCPATGGALSCEAGNARTQHSP